MTEFKMPSLGADMDSGTLFEWLVVPGAHVNRGDVIASVETDKGVIDVECFHEGNVSALLVTPGTRVPVGETIAIIATEDEAIAAEGKPIAAAPAIPQLPIVEPPPPARPAAIGLPQSVISPARARVSPAARKLAAELGVDVTRVVGTGESGAIHLDDIRLAAAQPPVAAERPPTRVTPVARHMAEDLGVDVAQITGSGPHGTVMRADIAAAADKPTPPPVATEVPPTPPTSKPDTDRGDFQTAMRRAIALAMAKSNREIPHYYLETRINVSRPLAWLEAENTKRSVAERILPVILFIKATAKALAEVPELNGFWRDDHFEASESIHIGFAISLRQGGLVTPAIHDADAKSLDELMVAMRDLITRTRGGRLRSSELTDATVTLTSLGDTGVEKVFGVIYPPQVALVGFGRVTDQPWAENGMLGVRPIVTATLAGDHRASDGRRGAQFLAALEKQLQEPEAL